MNKNSIRSAQLLTPFGIAQIVNFPLEMSMMICGLDLWDQKLKQRKIEGGHNAIDENILRISDRRLQRLLDVSYFRKPFPHNTSSKKNNHLTIPGVRFPQWHHCTKPGCGRMREVELTFTSEKVECPSCRSKMIPVRFVAACPHGHIQDVPFREWVHNGPVPDDGRKHEYLSYITGSGSGDLGSIYIKCECNDGKSLAGLMNVRKDGNNVFDSALARIGLNKDEENNYTPTNPNNSNSSGQYCRGYQPWLGLDGIANAENCNSHLQVLIRGGSNIHYSNIISALYLPETNEDTNPIVAKIFERLGRQQLESFSKQDSSNSVISAVLQSQPEVINGQIPKDELLEGIIAELNRENESDDVDNESDLRQEEYKCILRGRNSENTDFKALKMIFDEYDEKELLENYFETVVLIEKLKETRVFTGFSRINPDNSDRQGKMRQLSREPVEWLPACEVFGEGIFLKFRDDRIDEWIENNGDKFNPLIERYHSAMFSRSADYERRDINGAFVMIHTFAHLLIKRLCFNCGYGSSSLRERIYFSSVPEDRMNGVLIYTSSGDSEGSMGGLVRQGKEQFLGKLMKDSTEDARWCSSDPVCSDIGKSSGQGPDNINGSACHNCCIIPETSCEEYNMLLDRSAIYGYLDDPSIGYFNF
ncbi:MAG: DUF1998 domain-containing protein [Candidatus Scalindua sp.]|jgi:hypothetical protein|nr:DUF1998 domain-containing protein [Candidatus Scalindua sp.]